MPSKLYLIEILHQTTTARAAFGKQAMLYLIEILHQTTTIANATVNETKLYLIEILHQTTTNRSLLILIPCCILSKFYIKPQLVVRSMS